MQHPLSRFEKGELVEHYREFIKMLPEYVDLSRDMASDHAESWREFEVGNLGVIARPGVAGLMTVGGANFKIRHIVDADDQDDDPELEAVDLHDGYDIPRDVPPFCAEMATATAIEDDEVFFVGHVTTATTNVDEIAEVTGVRTATLPPCKNCTKVLSNNPNTSQATLYVSAGLDENICQVRNIRLLEQLHRTGKEKRLTVGRVGNIALNGQLSPETERSLQQFNDRIKNHTFASEVHSRAISSFARSAITATVVRR